MRGNCCQAFSSPLAHSCERAQVSGKQRYSRGFGSCNPAISRKWAADGVGSNAPAAPRNQRGDDTKGRHGADIGNPDGGPDIRDMLWPRYLDATNFMQPLVAVAWTW